MQEFSYTEVLHNIELCNKEIQVFDLNPQGIGPELTGILCCSLRDQRCHQHHDHKPAPHLAPHYSYGRGICTAEKRSAVCKVQIVV